MKHTFTHTQTIVTFTCDFCWHDAKGKCIGCYRDACTKCACPWDIDPFTGSDNGDSPPLVCDVCHQKSIEIGMESRQLLNDAYDKVEEMRNKWKEACNGK